MSDHWLHSLGSAVSSFRVLNCRDVCVCMYVCACGRSGGVKIKLHREEDKSELVRQGEKHNTHLSARAIFN